LHQIDQPLRIETEPQENPADTIIQYYGVQNKLEIWGYNHPYLNGGVHAGHGPVAAEAVSRTPTWIPGRHRCGRVGDAGSWEDARKLDLWYWVRSKRDHRLRRRPIIL
jgi:hypothetical protein